MKKELIPVLWGSALLLLIFGTTYAITPDCIWRNSHQLELHVLVWWLFALIVGLCIRGVGRLLR